MQAITAASTVVVLLLLPSIHAELIAIVAIAGAGRWRRGELFGCFHWATDIVRARAHAYP